MVGELAEAYEDKGFLRVLGEREPVTGLQRARAQNLMDEYRYLAEQMRLEFQSEAADESDKGG
jgi:hypothetical protein